MAGTGAGRVALTPAPPLLGRYHLAPLWPGLPNARTGSLFGLENDLDGITIGIDPVIVQLGSFALRWYSLFFAIAIVAGVRVGLREAARKGIVGEQVQSLAIWAVVGGMVGARLFHVLDRWGDYADDPLRILNVWEGGLAVYGGLIGGLLTGLAYALRHGLPVWKLADAAAPGMVLGQGLGRLACIPNGDAIGAPADVPWAFIYTNPKSMAPADLLGVPTQPYAVYELLFNLAVFALLWRLRRVFRTDGLLFLTYVLIQVSGRFLLTSFRVEKVWFWGLQEAQVVALLAVAIALPLLLWRLRTGAGAPRPAPAEVA